MPLIKPQGLLGRLAEIMPKKPEPAWTNLEAMRIELHPIRQHADMFVSWLDGELPEDEVEMRAVLWVFGELLCGGMERMLNTNLKLQDDLAACTINPVRIMDKEEQ